MAMDAKANDSDQGHRYGNFPNYYAFHPPQHRLQVLERTHILRHIRDGLLSSDAGDEDAPADAGPPPKKPRAEAGPTPARSVRYCDLGCNAGDLTRALAAALADGAPSHVAVRALGLDLDPALIARANAHVAPAAPAATSCGTKAEEEDPASIARANANLADAATSGSTKAEDEDPPVSRRGAVTAAFRACDLCSPAAHDGACAAFAARDAGPDGAAGPPPAPFDLTSIFSTTMWIHVHAGDDGLRAFLERACRWTRRFLLIEPQPSGCYRKANLRLRKMGRPELDVASSRLEMRPDVERQIAAVVLRCGFRRVVPDEVDGAGRDGEAVTAWNRTLQLYERVP